MICCVFLDLSTTVTTAQYSHLIALIVMFTVAILQQATFKPPSITAYEKGFKFPAHKLNPKLAHILVSIDKAKLHQNLTI